MKALGRLPYAVAGSMGSWPMWQAGVQGTASATKRLASLGHLDHSAQAARADVNITHHAVDKEPAMLNVHDEPSIGVTVRVANLAAVSRLASTNITATVHVASTPLHI